MSQANNTQTQPKQEKREISRTPTPLSPAQRNPFSTKSSALRNIVTGVVAESRVNCDKSREVGGRVAEFRKGKNVIEHTFRKKDQVVTFASKAAVKLNNDEVQVDAQVMFQRLSVVTTTGRYENPAQCFEYEMCSYPTSLFDESLLPRKASKPVLADAIWSMTKDSDVLIVKTAVAKARTLPTLLIGDDTDLLVLLLHYAEKDASDLFFRPEPHQRDKTRRTWNIKKANIALGPDVCSSILFVHAILDCDTTSRVHGIALKKVKSNAQFRDLLASVIARML